MLSELKRLRSMIVRLLGTLRRPYKQQEPRRWCIYPLLEAWREAHRRQSEGHRARVQRCYV